MPTSDWVADRSADADIAPPAAAKWETLATPVSHVFTHFALSLTIHHARTESDCMESADGEWWPLDALDKAGLPTLFAKVAHAVAKYEGVDG